MVQQAIRRAHNGEDAELDDETRAAFRALRNQYRAQQGLSPLTDEDDESNGEVSGDDSDDEEESDEEAGQAEAMVATEHGNRLAVRFMDEMGRLDAPSRPSARMAILFLARASWDYEAAVDNFLVELAGETNDLLADLEAEKEREEIERHYRATTLPAIKGQDDKQQSVAEQIAASKKSLQVRKVINRSVVICLSHIC